MRAAFYDNPNYKLKQSKRTKKLWHDGVFNFLIAPLQTKICANPKCPNSYQVKSYDSKKYCSRACSATVNNSKRKKESFNFCLVCKKQPERSSYRFCSNKCQSIYIYKEFIRDWKLGKEKVENGKKINM